MAFTGAGGKTTGLFQLARALEPPVVVANSTHLGTWQTGFADHHLIVSRPEDIERFAGQVEGVTLFTGAPGDDDRLQGLDLEILDALRELADRFEIPVFLEADGSRQRPLKAPGDNEPVIPDWVTMVVVVAGLVGLGQPLNNDVVHRPERFTAISGIKIGEQITVEGLSRMLVHPQGGRKNIPKNARRVVVLNQADDQTRIDAGIRIGNQVGRAYDSILITSLNEQRVWRVMEPAAGVILAGGRSSRFGQPKMLLDWQGKPLIRHTAEVALSAGCDPLIVVTGAVVQPIQEALTGLPVVFVHNPAWELGQSTSVRAGIGALPENTGSVVFLLADQPFATTTLLRELVSRHSTTLAPAVAPRVMGQRANPVLFDRETFPRLLELEGDTGGRAILEHYQVEYVEWEDANLLRDIDTPDNYEQLRRLSK